MKLIKTISLTNHVGIFGTGEWLPESFVFDIRVHVNKETQKVTTILAKKGSLVAFEPASLDYYDKITEKEKILCFEIFGDYIFVGF